MAIMDIFRRAKPEPDGAAAGVENPGGVPILEEVPAADETGRVGMPSSRLKTTRPGKPTSRRGSSKTNSGIRCGTGIKSG
mgnify:CR=1 FL=1